MATIKRMTLEAVEAKCFSFGPWIEGYNVELTVRVDGVERFVHGQACSELPEAHEFSVTDSSLMALLENEDRDAAIDEFAGARFNGIEEHCFQELEEIAECESEYTPMFLIASRILMEMQDLYGEDAADKDDYEDLC